MDRTTHTGIRRRAVIIGIGAAAAAGLTGCGIMQGRGARGQVPAVQDGFIVQPQTVPAANRTAFLPEGDTLYMSGSINADSVAGLEAVRAANPEARRLVILEADGPAGSPESIAFGRAVRSAGLSTHLRNDSVAKGAAIEAYLGGTQRTLEDGAVIAVVRPADAEALKGFAAEMTGGDGYGRFAEQFGGRRRGKAMTTAEIGAMGVTTAQAGNVVDEEG